MANTFTLQEAVSKLCPMKLQRAEFDGMRAYCDGIACMAFVEAGNDIHYGEGGVGETVEVYRCGMVR